MIENLKPFYNRILRPFAHLFLRIGLHPNHVTVAGLIMFITAGYLGACGSWHKALVLVIIGALMDGLDGLLARESGKNTTFGAILDSSCDRLTEMALLGGVMVFYLQHDHYNSLGVPLCFSALCSSVMVSYIKARCEGSGIACSRGLLQRPERIILLCAGLLMGSSVMLWILGGVTVLGAVTAVQRLLQAARY